VAAANSGTAGATASPGQAERAPRAPPAPAPAAASKAGPLWPEDLATRWFEAAQDSKGSFIPVDCADRPLKQLLYREVPGGHEVVFQTPWGGEGFSLREVRRTEKGVELKLAPSEHKQAVTQLVYQREAGGQAGWVRDGKPLAFHPMEEFGRWRVRRVCIGSPFLEGITEEEYVSGLLAKAPKPGQEFQGRPPKPKLELVSWSGSLPEGFPTQWIELAPREEQALQVGCEGVVRSSRLELRNEDGKLVLEQPYLTYAVTQLKRGTNSVRMSLANPLNGTVTEEVEIRHVPGAAEATWAWTTVADAETETRRVLTLDAARALPQRVVCQ
jgi:hypothetical protein